MKFFQVASLSWTLSNIASFVDIWEVQEAMPMKVETTKEEPLVELPDV